LNPTNLISSLTLRKVGWPSLFKKESQTEKKPRFDEKCRDITEEQSKARQKMIQN